MPDSNRFELLIGGADTPASGGGRLTVSSPATGEPVGSVADASAADADRAVAAAAAAFGKWSALTAYEREKAIKAAVAHVRTKADEIGRLMVLEQGKPLGQAKSEVLGACDTLDY